MPESARAAQRKRRLSKAGRWLTAADAADTGVSTGRPFGAGAQLHRCGSKGKSLCLQIDKICQKCRIGSSDRILSAAENIFARFGYRRASMSQIAEEAGLTRHALYHHYASKEALFRAVVEQLHEFAYEALEPGEIIESIELGIPAANERALYRRAISRSHAEWRLVEVVVRAVIADGAFKLVRIVSGAIAPVPLRLVAAESAAQGAAVNAATIANAVAQSTLGAKPLTLTGYKLDLLQGLVRDLLERVSA